MFAELGLDIERVSYNKVVDVHTLFLEASGTPGAHAAADARLREMGLYPSQRQVGSVQLVEFEVRNAVGALEPILSLIDACGFNITYVNAKVMGEDLHPADPASASPAPEDAGRAGAGPAEGTTQVVQMGLYVEDPDLLDRLVRECNGICPTRLRAYDPTLEVLDNNLFYVSFARDMARKAGLSEAEEQSVMVNANRIIQNLERTNADPYRPFDCLRRFAEAIVQNRGELYARGARVTRFRTALGARGLLVEPACGSDTWVLDCDDRYLAIDSGYACFADELDELLARELPDWRERRRDLFLTHGDVDHAGGCRLFDHVWAVDDVMENFRLELRGEPDWRDRIPEHRPYVRITNHLTRYRPPFLGNFTCLGTRPEAVDPGDEPIARCVDPATGEPATLDVPPFRFEVWQGAGGHVRGETVLVDRAQHVCVSGDIFINVHGQTKLQHAFNSLAPYLMTSVDCVPDLERAERRYLFGLLGPGTWQMLGGHGALLEYPRG